jgi:hypothetical protein
MTVGSLITAARYNAIQAKVANVLGVGQAQFGYGQTLSSPQVSVRSRVSALEMENLRNDMLRAHVHQFGALPTLPTFNSTKLVTNSEYVTYESAANSILTNKNLIHPSQASLENKIESTRGLPWGGISQANRLIHRVRVTFDSTNHIRHYFNAGGEIRFSASLTNGTGFKSANWANTLVSMGTIRFDYQKTLAAPTLPVGNIGFFNLTTENQTIFSKGNTDLYQSPTDPYESNYYRIRARLAVNLRAIVFIIEFFDGTSNLYDESVTGVLSSSVAQYRPTGSYVEVKTPAYVNEVTLT